MKEEKMENKERRDLLVQLVKMDLQDPLAREVLLAHLALRDVEEKKVLRERVELWDLKERQELLDLRELQENKVLKD